MGTTGTKLARLWPLWLAVGLALYVFRSWYFSLGYLTFGDYRPVSDLTVRDAFPFLTLWLPQYGLGIATPLAAPLYSFLAWTAHLGLGFPLGERLLFFWFFPPLMIAGIYLLAYRLTGNPLASAAASLLATFNSWLLLAAIGGDPNFTNATALAVWVILGALAYLQSGRLSWLAVLTLAVGLQSAQDLRWVPPSVAFVAALCVAWLLASRTPRSVIRGCTVAGALVVGIVAENLYWILPRLFAQGAGPAPPAINLNPQWAVWGSVMNARDALALWNPYFVNSWQRPPLLFQHAPALGLVFPMLVFAAVILARRPAAYFFGATYVIGAAIAAGANPPLGNLYVWMFAHVPLMNAYRDPGIFEFIPVLSGSLVIALGLAAVPSRRNSLTAHLCSAAVVGVSLLLVRHAMDPTVGGALTARSVPIEYRRFNSWMEGDKRFGRVLWLPGTPRWYAMSDLHPAADGLELGRAEFFPWCMGQRPGADPLSIDPLSYVQSPLFGRLLEWGGFRYVAVPLDIESDATIDGGQPALTKLARELSASRAVESRGRIGNILIFRVRRTLPLVWQTNAATLITGTQTALAAGAPFPELLDDRVMAFAGDVKGVPLPFRSDLQIQGDHARVADVSADHFSRRDWLLASNSLIYGPGYGGARIDAQRPPSRSWRAETFEGTATVPVRDPLVDATPWTALRREGPLPSGEVIGEGAGVTARKIARWGSEGGVRWLTRSVQSVPLYTRPSVSTSATREFAPGQVGYALFALADPVAHRQYVLVTPFAPERSTWDLHNLAWDSLMTELGPLPPLAREDRYDRLLLDGVTLLVSREPRALGKATSRHAGMLVRFSVRELGADGAVVTRTQTAGRTRVRPWLGELAAAGRVVRGAPHSMSGKSGRIEVVRAGRLVPLAVDYWTGTPPAAKSSPVTWRATNGSRIVIRPGGGSEWLVLTQRFDPGWELIDANGKSVGRHFRAFGLLNAWYVPGGVRGAHWLVYRPNADAARGEVVGILLFAGIALAGVYDAVGRREEVMRS